jgi:diguanylate cyclase (GGDEF)-like protein/PAS domain S-box-containing protein
MVLDRLLAPAQTIGAAPELPASIRADLEAAVGGERREVAWAGSHGECYQAQALPVPGCGGCVVVVRDVAAVRDRERRRRQLDAHLSEVVAVLRPDGVCTWVSSSVERMLGWRPEDLVGQRIEHFVHLEDAGRLIGLPAALRSGGEHEVTVRLRAHDGEYRWFEGCLRATLEEGAGTPVEIVCVGRDITQRRLTEDMLRAREDDLRRLVENSADFVSRLSPDGIYRYASPSVRRLLGWEPSDLVGRTAYELIHPDDVDHMRRAYGVVLDDEVLPTVTARLRARDGTYRWMQSTAVAVRTPDGLLQEIQVASRDVTEQMALQQRLEHLADHDPLTNLANRRRFERVLEAQVGRSRRYGEVAALLLVDLDGFKQVNDRFGHLAGDCVLQAAADAIRSRLRSTDEAARLGGDEFAVLLVHAGPEVVERVRRDLGHAIEAAARAIESITQPISASIGAAVIDGEIADRDAAFRAADVDLYRAKPHHSPA